MRRSITKRKMDMQRRSFFGRNLAHQIKRPLLLNEQMSQWAELHRISGAAMKDVIIRLWPTEPILDSYFGLVQRVVDAVPRIAVVKWSACIEGARMAFA